MGDLPKITDYITPAPPFMAGTDALSKAISDIWKKRQDDELLRIQKAQQAAQQGHWEALAVGDKRSDLETARHNLQAEEHATDQLERQRHEDLLKYIGNLASADPAKAEVLGAYGGLFGIAPQAMAVRPVEEPGAIAADGTMAGPEPGVRIHAVPLPHKGTSIPGGQPMVPPMTPEDAAAIGASRGVVAPIPSTAAAPPGATPLPQAATGAQAPTEASGQAPAPPQAELNAPKPAAPVQLPVVTPSDRRSDIHIQPKPPDQLGRSVPVPSGGSTVLPGTPTDPRKHPTAREANPDWQQAPTTFPGAPPVQHPPGLGPVMPTGPGAAAGAAPGGVDPVTGRRWFSQHGIAGPVLPDRQAIEEGNARRVREALEPAYGLAFDGSEVTIVRSGIEAGVRAAQTMSPEEARNKGMEVIRDNLRMYRQGQRSRTAAEAQAGRYQRSEDRDRANRYVERQKEAIHSRGLDNDIAAQQAIEKMKEVLQSPNPTEYAWIVREALTVMKNKGVSTDRDAVQAEGKANLSFLDNIKTTVQEFINGPSPLLIENMKAAIERLDEVLTDRTLRDYESHRDLINESAPNDNARDDARSLLRERYQPFTWSKALFDEERGGKPASRAAPPAKPKGKEAEPQRPKPPKVPSPPSKPIPDVSDLGVEVR